MILENKLAPGEKILQEKLAETLGISRMPLHKAFQMLENELLVVSIPRRGIFVKKFDLQEVYDAFEFREAIEGLAANRAAGRISPEEVKELYQLFKPFRKDPAAADLKKYEESDREFHKRILYISGNKLLERMEMFGNIMIKTYQRGLIRGPKETLSEHLAIIKALEDGDPEAAEFCMREHFKKSKEKIHSLL